MLSTDSCVTRFELGPSTEGDGRAAAGRLGARRRNDSAGTLLTLAALMLPLFSPVARAIDPEWQLRVPSINYRERHAMAFDSARGVAVLFGGTPDLLGREFLADIWEWDGGAWTPRNVTGPSGRWGHAMAFDGARGVTVLFGGRDEDGDRNDLWEWDGEAWSLRGAKTRNTGARIVLEPPSRPPFAGRIDLPPKNKKGII